MAVIRKHINNYDWTTVSGVILLGFAFGLSGYGYWLTNGWIDWKTIFTDFYANISAEAGSIAITVIIIDRLNERRETQRLKSRLTREAGSKANNTAVSAVDWLRHEDWLTGEDGLLKGADLWRANLTGANLVGAHLEGADLSNAHLEGANLYLAHLEDANLVGAHLEGADLTSAHLEDADLRGAHLEGAKLQGAHLEGAKLQGAHLEDVKLQGATLPDNTKWTEETDMTRFTDEQHPDFWRPAETE